MIPAVPAPVRLPTIGEQVYVRFENEPDALFKVVPAEGGGLAVIAASGASDEVYGFDPSEDEWHYPAVEIQREIARGRTTSSRNRIPSKKNAMEDKMQGGAESFSNEAERKRARDSPAGPNKAGGAITSADTAPAKRKAATDVHSRRRPLEGARETAAPNAAAARPARRRLAASCRPPPAPARITSRLEGSRELALAAVLLLLAGTEAADEAADTIADEAVTRGTRLCSL
jgi:hypothetical protein